MVDVVPVLNKTYYDSRIDTVSMSTTTANIFTSKEFTIQKNKAMHLTVQVPFTPLLVNTWNGCYIATSIKVDGTWFDAGNSGVTIAMSRSSVRPERYYDSKYIDLIGDNIVAADASYKVVVKLRGKMYGSGPHNTGGINNPLSFINQAAAGSGNRGLQIDEVASQNGVSIIIQEKSI